MAGVGGAERDSLEKQVRKFDVPNNFFSVRIKFHHNEYPKKKATTVSRLRKHDMECLFPNNEERIAGFFFSFETRTNPFR